LALVVAVAARKRGLLHRAEFLTREGNMSPTNWDEVEARFAELPLPEQMLLLERLMRRMREGAYPINSEEADRQLEEMANDAEIQRELRMLRRPEQENTAQPREAV
jgi:hypothetical protein